MTSDEQQIRELVARWHALSGAGDVDAVLALMTDDAVFLGPGRPPMGRAEFEAISRVPPGAPLPTIESRYEIVELEVAGDWAWMWARLQVRVSAPSGATTFRRAGDTLTVLRRVGGAWRIARDANMLAPAEGP